MKSYIVRAYHFAKYVFSRANMYDYDEVFDAVNAARRHFHIYAEITFGSSRYVIKTKDFVIKWDRGDCYEIGLCEDELKMYKWAEKCGYEYLLAKITPIYFNNKFFYVMPTIEDTDPRYNGGDISAYLDEMEFWWVSDNIKDLHGYNWGLRNGKPVIIDYAFHN